MKTIYLTSADIAWLRVIARESDHPFSLNIGIRRESGGDPDCAGFIHKGFCREQAERLRDFLNEQFPKSPTDEVVHSSRPTIEQCLATLGVIGRIKTAGPIVGTVYELHADVIKQLASHFKA